MKKQKNKVILQNKPSSKLKTLQWKNKKTKLFYKTSLVHNSKRCNEKTKKQSYFTKQA